MKNKKQFLGILISVMVCVLVVFAGVYAGTTTVSSFISVNGASTNTAHNTEFGVVGTASISEDVWASGSFQFGAGDTTASVSYSRLGAGTTGHSLVDADDLMITGLLEVNDVAYFDSMVQIGNTGSAPYTELSVVGTASISEDLWASGSFQFGGGDTTASLSYSRLGTATTGHSLADADDLLVTGLLEVNETAFFDAAASVGADLSVEGGDFSVSGDITLTGDDLTFGNAAVITNTDVDTLTLTEQLFDLNGTLDISNDLIVGTGPLQVGSTATVAYSRFGAGVTDHATITSASSDLLISDALEVDGKAIFDNIVSVSDANGIRIGGGITLSAGTASPSADCVAGSIYFMANSTASASLYFCDTTNEWDVMQLDTP